MKQLAIANKSIGGGVIVVLAERDKEEMEMDIAKLEFDFMGTSVICRSGSPLILADLKKVCWSNFCYFFQFVVFWSRLIFVFSYSQVSVSKARAIIVLASDENADQVLFFLNVAIQLHNLCVSSCKNYKDFCIFVTRVMHVP